jgi:hypothetical protein
MLGHVSMAGVSNSQLTSTADLAVLVPAAREPEAPAGTDPDLTAIEVSAAEMTATAPPLPANARARLPGLLHA